MDEVDFDEAFARHLRQAGLITPEQLAKAQAEGGGAGLPDVLVRLGLLTAGQRESLVRKVREQKDGLRQVGPFALSRKLGQGGMGAVYLAAGPDGAAVAVKVLFRQHAANPESRQRFRREAEAAMKLDHRHLVRALSSGEDEGHFYYAMEYVEGGTLDTLLARNPRPSIAEILGLILQVARGLEYAHAHGFLHRDVKPANILLTRDGVAKLLDLGLSKDLGNATSSLQTVTGAILGTPHYMSPEQARGEKSIDARSDIYSLGATFYHLLTGSVPFEGTTALEILAKHVHQRLPDPREFRGDIPDGVVQVLQRMMAKDPCHRYRDAAALLVDLDEVAAGRPPKSERILAELTTLQQRRVGPPPRIRRRRFGWIAALPAVLIVVLTAFALRGGAPAASPPLSPAAAEPDWIDLLPSVDFARDIRVGGWARQGAAIVADGSENAGLQIPYAPPAEYDVRLEFTRPSDGCETGLYLVREGTPFLVGLAGYGGKLAGIGRIGGKDFAGNPTRVERKLVAGHRYRLDVEVRRDFVRALVDGEEWLRWTPAMGTLDAFQSGGSPEKRLLGISNCETRTVFHRLAILERTGRGTAGR